MRSARADCLRQRATRDARDRGWVDERSEESVCGRGSSRGPTVASDIAARTLGLPFYRSSVYEPWGVGDVIEATDGPTASGYVVYHLTNVAPIPEGSNVAEEDNDAHDDLRFTEPMLRQLDQFCRPDGRVIDTCPDGSCAIANPRAER